MKTNKRRTKQAAELSLLTSQHRFQQCSSKKLNANAINVDNYCMHMLTAWLIYRPHYHGFGRGVEEERGTGNREREKNRGRERGRWGKRRRVDSMWGWREKTSMIAWVTLWVSDSKREREREREWEVKMEKQERRVGFGKTNTFKTSKRDRWRNVKQSVYNEHW